MPFTDAELAMLRAGLPRWAGFFHLACDPPQRLWTGVGNIKPGVNLVDIADGAVYRNFGELLEAPALFHLFDGTAQRIDIPLSGTADMFSNVAATMVEVQAAIQGCEVYIGWAAMDYSWSLLGAVSWDFCGFADLLKVSHRNPNDAKAPAIWTITLSCGDWNTGRRRASLSMLSDPDQKARAALLNPASPPDRGAERVGLYNSGVEKPWPPA